MKKILMVALFSLLTQIIFAQSKDIAQILPEDTRLLIKIKSIEDAFKSIGLTEKLFFGQSLEKAKKQITKETGFNLLDLASMKKIGVNVSGSLGMAMGGFTSEAENLDKMQFYVTFFVPVANESKAVADFKKLIAAKKPKFKIKSENNINYLQDYNDKLYFYAYSGYLFFIIAKEMNIQDIVNSFKQGKKLAENTMFKNIDSKINSKEDFFVYVDLKTLFVSLYDKIKTNLTSSPDGAIIVKALDILKDYEGMGMNISLKNKDLIVKSAVTLKEGSDLIAMTSSIPVKRDVILTPSENLGLLFSMTLDLVKYLNLLEKVYPIEITQGITQAFDEFKLKFGVDLKQDFLSNLDGNFNLAVYDAKTINLFNYNTLMTVGVKDESKTKAVLDTIVAKIPAEQKNMVVKDGDNYIFTVMGMVQIAVGVKNNTLIIASSKPMFEKTNKKGSSFLEKIKDSKLADSLKGKLPFIFYISLEEVYTAFKNFMAMSGAQKQKGQKPDEVEKNIRKYLPLFEYFLVTADIQGTWGTGEFIIKTKFKDPFFKTLSKMISQQQ